MSGHERTNAWDEASAWAAEWHYFFDGKHLGILKEVIRGHRMSANLIRHRAPEAAKEIDLAVAYLEALLPAPPEGAGPERSPA